MLCPKFKLSEKKIQEIKSLRGTGRLALMSTKDFGGCQENTGEGWDEHHNYWQGNYFETLITLSHWECIWKQ